MNPFSRLSTRARLALVTMTVAWSALAPGRSVLSPTVLGNAPTAAPAAPATAPATRPSFKHPAADAAARFQAAITRGDVDEAGRATADTAKPLADQPKRISQLIARQKNLKSQFMVHDVQVDGDLAAAVVGNPARIGDKVFESEIWFLICQGGQWRVLPDCNDYERPEYGFDASRIEAYKKLEERAEKRNTELRKEITGCEC